MVYFEEIRINTKERSHWVDITPYVKQVIGNSNIKNGIVCITSLHTTAGITINENADPDVAFDFFEKLNQLIPQDPSYRHMEGNSDSHLKTSLVGLSVQVSLKDKSLVLGIWQSVYFCEFDGPRNRRFSVSVVGD